MGRAEADDGLPVISICPRCGARLVTRNLWHSCGTYTLEGLFPTSEPAVLDLARKYVAMLYTLGDVRTEADLDNELRAWLQESHDVVGMQSDLRR